MVGSASIVTLTELSQPEGDAVPIALLPQAVPKTYRAETVYVLGLVGTVGFAV